MLQINPENKKARSYVKKHRNELRREPFYFDIVLPKYPH